MQGHFFATRALPCFVVGAVVVLTLGNAADFSAFFGPVPPLLGAILVCGCGIAALHLLNRNWGIKAFDGSLTTRNRLAAMGWAVPFMISVTAADLLLGFPADLNLAPPAALLFYPAMGAIAQIALHLIPFFALLWVTGVVLPGLSTSRRTALSIALASVPEALFQIPTSDDDAPPAMLMLFVIVQLFCFGITELLLLRRYDYLTMYSFRLSYYAWWHVVWGYLRLV